MEETGDNAMCFTVVGDNDLALWGYKVEDLTVAISETIAQLDKLIPASTAVDIALSTEGVYGATVSWKSKGIVMTDSGVVNPLKNDMDVVVTATITSGKYTFSKDYTIKVLGTDSVKTDAEVEIRSYYTDMALDISTLSASNYVQLDNPFYNTLVDISNGAVISFDVTRKGNADAYLSNLLSLTGTSGRLYFTGGSYLGYNGPGGFYDANVKNSDPWVAGTDLLATNQSVNIKLKFSSDGFEVYKDGTLAYSQSTLAAGTTQGGYNFAEKGNWNTLNNSLMDWLKNGAPYLNFGYGNWWGDQIFNGTISNVRFSYVQKAINLSESGSSLVGLYTQDYEKVTDISKEWTSQYAQDSISFQKDNTHGRYMDYTTGNVSGGRGAYSYTLGDSLTSANFPQEYIMEWDMALTAGNTSESQFVVATDNCVYGLFNGKEDSGRCGIDSGYVLKLKTTNSTTWMINDGTESVEIPKSTWVHVKLTGTKGATTAKVTITNGNVSICTDKEITTSGTATIKGLFILAGRSYASFKVDNIVVKEQGTDYANLSAYNSVLERANKFVAMQGETPVFTEASFNALTSAIATAESTVTSSLTSSQQSIIDAQVTALTDAMDGLALKGYTVTVGAAANGTVEGLAAGGSYSAGTSVSLTAKPDSGYAFGGWRLGTDDAIISKNASYSAMVTEDITITPVFVKAADLTEFNEVLASAEKIIAEQSASQVYTEETFSVL